MASSSSSISLLSSLLILCLLPFLSSARPCKPILVSYYSFTTSTLTTTTTSSASASADLAIPHRRPTTRFFTIYRIVPLFPRHYHHHHHHQNPHANPNPNLHSIPAHPALGVNPSSFQDRAKDILIVVGGLLFGLGCGMITASTMYLVWSLITNNRSDICGSDGEDSSEDEESPKKMGYVKIAAADPAVTDAAPAATAKEGYEGK